MVVDGRTPTTRGSALTATSTCGDHSTTKCGSNATRLCIDVAVTARQPTDPAGEWLTVGQAAAYLGLSASGFRAIGTTEGLEVRRRGNRPGVRRADLDAYLERARIQPGQVVVGNQLHGRTSHLFPASYRTQRADLPGVAEVDHLHELGWTDTAIAQALGLHIANVSRRRTTGFSPKQVRELRRLVLGP